MSLKSVYILLCVLGLFLPFSQFVPWIIENGISIELFVQELFSTKVGAFFGLDVIVSALVLIVFVVSDRARIIVPYWWISIVATLLVGVSLGLPLYLYLRESKFERSGLDRTQ